MSEEIQQIGGPREIYQTPKPLCCFHRRGKYPAGAIEGKTAGTRCGSMTVCNRVPAKQMPDVVVTSGGAVALVVRPENVALVPATGKRAAGAIKGRVSAVTYLGTDTQYAVLLEGGAEIIARVQNNQVRHETAFSVDDNVHVTLDSGSLSVLVE